MANFKYFNDNGPATVELVHVHHDAKGVRVGQPINFVPTFDRVAQKWNRVYLPVTRMIEMKARPSKHVCDDRCINATGKVMKCECSCGGKNHGKGHSHAEAA